MAKKKNIQLPNVETILDCKKDVLVDTHTHSIYSFDGFYEIDYMMWEARKRGLAALAVTDHNSLSGIRSYLRANAQPTNACFYKDKGTFFIPGVEITCRLPQVQNLSGNSSKFHVLAYGCDWSEDSPISRLMAIKTENDRLCDLGKLDYILQAKGLDKVIPEKLIREFLIKKRQDIKGLSSLGFDHIQEFFSYIDNLNPKSISNYGFTVEQLEKIQQVCVSFKSNRSARQAWNELDKNQMHIQSASYGQSLRGLYGKAPNYQRLNLDFEDVIDIIHASGGVAVVAHPGVNLDRIKDVYKPLAVKTIVEMGVDGFEIAASAQDSANSKLIRDAVKKHDKEGSVIYTAGSDLHFFSKGVNLAKYKNREIKGSSFRNLFDRLNAKQLARDRGEFSDEPVELDDLYVEDIIRRYDDQNEMCKGNITDAMTVIGPKLPIPKEKKKNFPYTEEMGIVEKKTKATEGVSTATKKETPPKAKKPSGFVIYPESGGSVFIPEDLQVDYIDGIPGLNMDEYNALKEYAYSDDRNKAVLEEAGLTKAYKEKMKY